MVLQGCILSLPVDPCLILKPLSVIMLHYCVLLARSDHFALKTPDKKEQEIRIKNDKEDDVMRKWIIEMCCLNSGKEVGPR